MLVYVKRRKMTHEQNANEEHANPNGTNQSAALNTTILLRPYSDYFTPKESTNGFFRTVRKNWGQMSILWPGESSGWCGCIPNN